MSNYWQPTFWTVDGPKDSPRCCNLQAATLPGNLAIAKRARNGTVANASAASSVFGMGRVASLKYITVGIYRI